MVKPRPAGGAMELVLWWELLLGLKEEEDLNEKNTFFYATSLQVEWPTGDKDTLLNLKVNKDFIGNELAFDSHKQKSSPYVQRSGSCT